MMAISGFGYSAYSVGKRERLAQEYRIALSDAVACLDWSLGKFKTDNKDAILKSENVQNLFDTLSPLMDEQQIRNCIDDRIETIFVNKAAQKSIDLFGRPLNKEEKALVYGIYGYEKGGVLDVGQGLWYLACHAVTWVVESIKALFNEDNEQASTHNTSLQS